MSALRPERIWPAALALVVALTAALSFADAREDAVTADEPLHVAAGLSQAGHGGWVLNLENPPLAKELFGRAARLAGARDGPVSFRAYFRSCQDALFRNPGGVSERTVLLATRTVTIGFFVLLVVVTYAAAGGGVSGLLGAAMVAGQAAFFPHGHLATADVPFAALGVAAVAATFRLRDRPSPASLLFAALLLSLAALTKFTGILLLPAVALLLLLPGRPDRAGGRRHAVALAVGLPLLASLLTVGLLRFWNPPSPRESLGVLSGLYRLPPEDRQRIEAIGSVDAASARYAAGLFVNLRHAEAGRQTWYLGKVTGHPSPAYHVVALLVTAPAIWLGLVAAGGILAAGPGAPFRARALLLAGALVFLLSLPGPRIGIRHVLLPAALFSAGAAVALAARVVPRVALLGVAVALSPLLLGRTIGREGLAARFFPRPAVADSNLDWGQDLLRLERELSSRGLKADALAIAYFGGDEPARRLPAAADLLRGGPLEGRSLLAVSRQLLLVGPEAALDPEGVPGARAAVAAARDARARFLFRAGTSIDVFELQPAGSR
jgi:hypothetical protein